MAARAAGVRPEKAEKGLSSVSVPDAREMVQVSKRRKTTPVMRTPAMRLGADPIEDPKKTQRPPDPRRVLYRPWLAHGTPLWRKFEDR